VTPPRVKRSNNNLSSSMVLPGTFGIIPTYYFPYNQAYIYESGVASLLEWWSRLIGGSVLGISLYENSINVVGKAFPWGSKDHSMNRFSPKTIIFSREF